MTVVACRDGVMACDSLVTCVAGEQVSSRYSNTKKLYRMPNGAILGGAGNPSLFNTLAVVVKKLILKRKPINAVNLKLFDSVDCLYLDINGVCWSFIGGANGGIMQLEGEFFAEGSGCVAALAAMHGGASAVRAVEIAILLNTECGPPVQSMRLDE